VERTLAGEGEWIESSELASALDPEPKQASISRELAGGVRSRVD